jgi:hypothetical protein
MKKKITIQVWHMESTDWPAYSSVEFNCMETGHTKFHPDWHFGLWKVLVI